MSVFTLAGRSSVQCARLRSTVQRNHDLFHYSKRQLSNKPSTRTQTTPNHRSIPGPSWVWIEPILGPFRAYGRMQKRSPLITQLSSSLTIYFLGDLSAQYVSGSGIEGEYSYEPIRGVRALIIGGISSIPSYKWFLFLGNHFNYSSHAVSIGVKILVNQTVFTPIFNSYFFGMQSLLSGSSLAEAKKRIIDTVPVSWKNSWKVWPAVTAFSFTFVAPQYRSVFAGVIAIGWQTYLSWLNMRAQLKEEAEGNAGGKKLDEKKDLKQDKAAKSKTIGKA